MAEQTAKNKKTGSEFLGRVTADGSSGFKAEAGRYHLYVALSCPFAGRTLVGRALKGLDKAIDITICQPYKEDGWTFTDKVPRCSLDTINNCASLKDVYKLAYPDYEGRNSVPVLWDKTTKTIVSNDSAEILRMINSEFNEFCPTEAQKNLDLYPPHLRDMINEINAWVLPNINLGVYGAGFARTQEVYDENVKKVFDHLDKADDILSKQRYLVGSQLTEADVRLFTSLVRFDLVYHTHFKCNKQRLVDYPSLFGFVCDIYQLPGVSDTVDRYHIMHTYYASHKFINPFGIVPIGPDLDFNTPHGRENIK